MSQIPEQNPIDAETLARAMAEPPLAGLRAGDAAYFIVSGARIIHASPAAQALFRTKDLDALTERLFKGSEPGARRLVDLARSLIPATPTRLERLRFFFGRATHTVTFACRRLAGPAPLFVAAALDAPAALLTLTTAEATTAPAKVTGTADASPAAVPVPTELSLPIAALAPPAEAAPRASGTVRFLWQTDRERRFVKLTGALCEAMGCQTADLIGQDFIAVAERFGVDRIEDLRTAFTRHETWSGLRVSWPINGTQDAAPVTLGGLPIFDEEHAFNGFSGFGVINLDKIVPRPTPAEDQQIRNELIQDPPVQDPPVQDKQNDSAATGDQTTAAAIADDDEHDALDDAREKMFAPPHPEPDYLNYAPNVVPLRDWQRDRQSANGQTDAPLPEAATPTETAPVEASATQPSVESAPDDTPELAAMEIVASDTSNAVASTPSIPEPDNDNLIALSASERQAFREIARSIVADIERGEKPSNLLPAVTQAMEGIGAGSPPASTADEGKKDGADSTAAHERAVELTAVIKSPDATPHQPVDPTPAQASAEQMREIAAALGVAGPIAKPAAEAPPSPIETMPTNAAAIFDRLNMGILVMLGGVPTFANRHLLDMLGFSDIDAFHDWGGPERMIHGQALDEHGADGTPMQIETHSGTLIKLNGRMQKTEWNGQPATLMTFHTAEAQQAGAQPAPATTESLPVKPDSETRAQDAEIRELHAILDTATDGVAILDGAGTILSLNRSAEALFGYERGEVAGQAFTTLFAKDSHKAALDYLEGLKSHGVRSVLNDGREVIGRARMGGQIPIFMTIGRIGSETSEKFCAVMRDMSDWKNAERELKDARREAEQASALKSDFLAKISHEIRTPLNAILGFAEVIIDERFGPVGNDRYKEYLRDIHASGTHVMSLVNDLLDLSKIEAGKLDLNFGAVDANKIVNECVSIMQPQSVRERVIMRLALAPHLPNIVADERALRQIVLNILSNAVKFNQPGGQVIVSTALTDSGQAVVRVRDTGIGMSEKDLEIALEPFRQIQTSRQTTGTGLGLPLTKALVEANRAAFSIKSKPGDGTLVEVTFPSTRVLAE